MQSLWRAQGKIFTFFNFKKAPTFHGSWPLPQTALTYHFYCHISYEWLINDLDWITSSYWSFQFNYICKFLSTIWRVFTCPEFRIQMSSGIHHSFPHWCRRARTFILPHIIGPEYSPSLSIQRVHRNNNKTNTWYWMSESHIHCLQQLINPFIVRLTCECDHIK